MPFLILSIIILAYISVNIFAILFSYSIIWGYTHIPIPPSKDSPDDYHLDYEDIFLETKDGLHIAVWIIPAVREKGGVVLASGNMGRRDSHLWEAEYLNDAGFTTVLFDYRGVGDSDRSIKTYGARESLDVKAILKYIRSSDKMGELPLFLYGNSMGVASVLLAGEEADDISGYILNSGYTSFYDAIYDKARKMGHPVIPVASYARSSFYLQTGVDPRICSSIKPLQNIFTPALIIHGGDDNIISPQHSKRIYEEWNSDDKDLWIVEGAWHCIFEREVSPEITEEYKTRVLGFLYEHI